MSGRFARRAAATALLLAVALHWLAARYDRPPGSPGAWMAAAGLEAREAKVGEHRLRFVRTGSGPSVVLVHGFASSLYTWKGVIPGLAASHDVVALDLPGFGGSDQPADLSFADYPATVLGLMDALGIERASLVGNSLGGAAVALVAAEHPGRVSALVLIDAGGFHLAEADRPAVVRFATSAAGRLLELLPLRRLAVEVSLRQVFHDPSLVTDERVSEYLAPLLRPGAVASIRSLARTSSPDAAAFAHALGGIEAPTLVVWGRDDTWIPVADADRFVSAIPGAEKIVLDDCGHVPQEERPAAVTEALVGFLDPGRPWRKSDRDEAGPSASSASPDLETLPSFLRFGVSI